MFSRYVKAAAKVTDAQLAEIKTALVGKSWTTTDDSLSAYKGRQFYATLQSVLQTGKTPLDYFKNGSLLPYGYSLAYCNPIVPEFSLSSDGYDNFSAPTSGNLDCFNRRMWVGGEFAFEPLNRLKFGDKVGFEEKVTRVRGQNHNSAIFVDVERSYTNDLGLSQVEKRRICYLHEKYKEAMNDVNGGPEPDRFIIVRPSAITNFRMSALTFNSHQLHYNPEYCKEVERYPAVVLQAPLLFSLAMKFWMDTVGAKSVVKRVKYKVSRPMFVDEQVKVCFKREEQSRWRLWLSNEVGEECFVGTLMTQ